MKKRTWLLAMLLVCALAFAGCTSQQKPTGEDAQKEDQQEEQLTEEKTEEEQPESPEAGENADQAEDAQQPEEEEKDQAQSSGQGSQDTASKPSGGQEHRNRQRLPNRKGDRATAVPGAPAAAISPASLRPSLNRSQSRLPHRNPNQSRNLSPAKQPKRSQTPCWLNRPSAPAMCRTWVSWA